MTYRYLFALACSGLLFTPAWALDATADIKVSPLLQTDQSWNGTALHYPAGHPAVSAMLIEIAPGAQTGWHLHEVPSFAYVLDGELEVELKNGSRYRAGKGDSFAEVVNTLHNGRNVGSTPVRLLVWYISATDKQLTRKEAAK